MHATNIVENPESLQVLRALPRTLNTSIDRLSTEEWKRIGKALALVEHGHVSKVGTAWHIRSQCADSSQVYVISKAHGCQCMDKQKRREQKDRSLCKHEWAMMLSWKLTWAMNRAHYAAYVKEGVYIEGYAWPDPSMQFAWFIAEHGTVPKACQPWDITVHGKILPTQEGVIQI